MTPQDSPPVAPSWLLLGILAVATVLQGRTSESASQLEEPPRPIGCPSRAQYDPFGREGRELAAEIDALMDRLMTANTRDERDSIKRQFDVARQRWELLRAKVRGHGSPVPAECRSNPLQKGCM